MSQKRTNPTGTPSTGDTSGISGPLAVGEVLLLALGFSIWTGLIEQIVPAMFRMTGAVVRLSPASVWMTPLSDALFFVMAAAFLLALGARWPRARSRPVVLAVFFTLSTLAVGLLMEKLYPAAVLLLAIGVGAQAGRRARPVRKRRWSLPAISGMGLLLVLGLTARSLLVPGDLERRAERSYAQPPEGTPNILLLILDTVRGISLDFTSQGEAASQWSPVTAPALESLADRSLVFTQAFAPSPWTLPSHASMFTGRWPNDLSGPRGNAMTSSGALPTGYPTVAEVLTRQGYRTGGFVGNLLFASAQVGLGRGFQSYHDYQVTPAQVLLSSSIGRKLSENALWRRLFGYHDTLNRKRASVVTDQFLDWQAGLPEGPFFAFLNYFDPHEPYFPPDSIKATMPDGSRWDEYEHLVRLVSGAMAWRAEKWTMDPAERRAHAAGYNDAIRKVDEEIARVLEELESRGVLDNTVIVLAGDHGEQLGEHDLFGHMNSLYLPALHVPLLIHDPRTPELVGQVSETVSLRNVGATILELAGLDPEPARIQGKNLLRYARTAEGAGDPSLDRSEPPDTVFAVLFGGAQDRFWYPSTLGPAMFAVVDSAYHYILNGDGSEELYARRDDPGEMETLAFDPAYRPVLYSFRRTLGGLQRMFRPPPEDPGFQPDSAEGN